MLTCRVVSYKFMLMQCNVKIPITMLSSTVRLVFSVENDAAHFLFLDGTRQLSLRML